MFITSEKINHFVGTWKFSKNITQQQLEEIAKEWAESPLYLSITIREASKEQMGINFEYFPQGTIQKAFTEYCENTSDYLKRKTGNGLVGWDISMFYYKIK